LGNFGLKGIDMFDSTTDKRFFQQQSQQMEIPARVLPFTKM
jgi:hypothetical protein